MIVQGPDGVRIDFGDASLDQIKAAMSKRYPRSAASPMPEPNALPWYIQNAPDVTGILPAAGGTIGGLIGAAGGGLLTGGMGGQVPGGIEGAAYGGMIGKMAQNTIRGEPVDAGNVLLEGGKQAALEATGLGLAKGAVKYGPKVVPALGKAGGFLGNIEIARELIHGSIPTGGIAARIITHPVVASKIAQIMVSPAGRMAGRQGPRAVAALLTRSIGQSQPDATSTGRSPRPKP